VAGDRDSELCSARGETSCGLGCRRGSSYQSQISKHISILCFLSWFPEVSACLKHLHLCQTDGIGEQRSESPVALSRKLLFCVVTNQESGNARIKGPCSRGPIFRLRGVPQVPQPQKKFGWRKRSAQSGWPGTQVICPWYPFWAEMRAWVAEPLGPKMVYLGLHRTQSFNYVMWLTCLEPALSRLTQQFSTGSAIVDVTSGEKGATGIKWEEAQGCC
jgi:hypothetical protein